MSKGVVGALVYAKPCGIPEFILNTDEAKPRKGSPRHQGLYYEKQVARVLPQPCLHSQWFEFVDSCGRRYCQPDYLLPAPWGLAIVEVKLTDTPEAKEQLRHLYIPVVERALGKPCRGIIICKNLTSRSERRAICHDWNDALWLTESEVPVLHIHKLDPH